jgi:S1-C subfamily serine protease
MAQLVAVVDPAVVRIDVTGPGFTGMGSGFIVDESGYVLTNQHTIANATSIKVTLATGDSFTSNVVDSDANRDLALLKLDSTRMDFPVIQLASASDAAVGDSVLVVGFPLGNELSGAASYTNGIISAVRTINGLQYFQTDAAINTGNSGGPVIGMRGTLLGMVVSSVTDTNLGLAIPVADVLKFIDSGRISCSNCHYVA